MIKTTCSAKVWDYTSIWPLSCEVSMVCLNCRYRNNTNLIRVVIVSTPKHFPLLFSFGKLERIYSSDVEIAISGDFVWLHLFWFLYSYLMIASRTFFSFDFRFSQFCGSVSLFDRGIIFCFVGAPWARASTPIIISASASGWVPLSRAFLSTCFFTMASSLGVVVSMSGFVGWMITFAILWAAAMFVPFDRLVVRMSIIWRRMSVTSVTGVFVITGHLWEQLS